MTTKLKTPAILQRAKAVATVASSQEQAARPRSISKLAASALVAAFVTMGSTLAPVEAQAQNYQSAHNYSVSTGLTGRVVGVSYYQDYSQNERAMRNQFARENARQRVGSLIGSVVYQAANRALGGNNGSYYSSEAAGIGASMASDVANNVITSRSRVNSEWRGNVRAADQEQTVVTVDVRYPNGQMERLQVRQPASYSHGLETGDEVNLIVQGSGRNQTTLAIETPRSKAGYRPR